MPRPKTLKLPTTYCLAGSLQGDRLVALGRSVVLANPETMTRIASVHPLSHPSDAAFSPDGKCLAVKSTSGRLVLLSPDSGDIEHDFRNAKDGEGPGPIFSHCSNYIVDASWKGQIFVRAVTERSSIVHRAFAGEMIQAVLSSNDRHTWAFVHQKKATADQKEPLDPPYISVWAWPFSQPRILRLNTSSVSAAALSPDGSTIALSTYTDIQFIALSSGRVVKTLALEGCREIRWSTDGALLGIVLQSSILVSKYPSFASVAQYEMAYASDVHFGPDASFIALGSWNGGLVSLFNQ